MIDSESGYPFGARQSSKVPGGLVGRSDVDVVKAVFAAFAERDLERVLELAAPDVEFIAVTSDYAGRTEPYRGHDGIRQYFRDVAEVWDELRLTPTDYGVVGDQVLVTGRVSARSPARVVSGSTGWVWRVRSGKVIRGLVYPSAEEAVAALRAEETRGSGS
jgi:ketosteroid isomerase-like protein